QAHSNPHSFTTRRSSDLIKREEMNYKLVKDVIDLIAQFEIENKRAVPESEPTVEHFKQWIATHSQSDNRLMSPLGMGKKKDAVRSEEHTSELRHVKISYA